MSLPRLPFLYPHLFKQGACHENRLAVRQLSSKSPNIQKARISTSVPFKQETYAQRYGTAAEPQPPPPSSSIPPRPQEEKSLAGVIEKEVQSPSQQGGQKKTAASPEPSRKPLKPAQEEAKSKPDGTREDAINATVRDPSKRASELNASESHPKESVDTQAATKIRDLASKSKPLETVLQISPKEEKPEEHRAPHLQAPPYVHHFDTFTLVKDLERGGFTEDQSVTIMKAVRALLAINLDVAREGLVSKSDVENETYLFRAACSELRTEIINTRKASSTKTRTQLAHLQHNHDILSQRVSQETLALRDDLRGMLNDRRMSVRMQHQVRDSEIQELNNMISVRLNSDAKSEIEGLRWVLTRRAALAIAGMAVLILGSLRFGSYKMHERESEARRVEGAGGRGQGSSGNGVGHTVSSREMGTQTQTQTQMGESGAAGVEKAENAGYVSLG